MPEDKPINDYFQKQQLEKRDKLFEMVHAAFVLNTSLSTFVKPTDSDLGWLASAYPNSEVKIWNDQGASYYTITPKF